MQPPTSLNHPCQYHKATLFLINNSVCDPVCREGGREGGREGQREGQKERERGREGGSMLACLHFLRSPHLAT